jgi:TusA-related sulfurtransferase
MTVKELKKALRGVPEGVEVSILIDGYESESRAPWMAHYTKEVEEDGEVTIEFRINC